LAIANRQSLKDEAYHSIKETLLKTEGSSDAFSERQLATELNIGLGPVRSALERLRAEGLIVVAPNLGIRLPEITSDAIIDFYEMRTSLSSMCCGLSPIDWKGPRLVVWIRLSMSKKNA
jgi:DNA-binding GntR family transcriptional regulator